MTVVDAATGGDTLEWSTEARKQAILADRLVITKTDIAGRRRGRAARRRNCARSTPAPTSCRRSTASSIRAGLVEPADDERNAFVAEAEHSDGIASFVLTDSQPMPWPVFARAMETLMTMRGADLLRVKGFLNVEGCKGPVVVQFVQHLRIRRWSSSTGPTATGKAAWCSSRAIFRKRRCARCFWRCGGCCRLLPLPSR